MIAVKKSLCGARIYDDMAAAKQNPTKGHFVRASVAETAGDENGQMTMG